MAECTLNPTAEDVADFIYPYSGEPFSSLYTTLGTNCIEFVINQFIIAYRPLASVLPISPLKHGIFHIPNLYGLLDTTALTAAGITAVFANPNLNSSGNRVIIGFVDTGIDYQNDLFQFSDGTSRIVGLWDQTIQQGHSPNEYYVPYGAVYTKKQLDQALAADDPLSVVPSQDTNGHGTFMAGIAAGNSSPKHNFIGVAPDSMIAAVKIKPAKKYLRDYFLIANDVPAFQENDIMMAIRFLIQQSSLYNAPVVIYLGIGSNQGGHTGDTPLSLLIKSTSLAFSTFFVTGAGNETGLHHHYFAAMIQGQEFEDVEIRVAQGERGFCTELWCTVPELLSVGFVTPAGETIDQIHNYSESEKTIPLYMSDSTITVTYLRNSTASGNSVILMRFDKPMPGIWHIRVYSTVFFTGKFNLWLPMGNFISPNTAFLKPEPNTTVTDPGNSAYILTVAAYNHLTSEIYLHSSRGFSLNDTIVPVLAAPGVNIYGPMPGSDEFTRRSGTSVAAAMAAGAVADYLSWLISTRQTLSITNASIMSFFIHGAQKKPGIVYPSREWGYGTLNLYRSFQEL